MRKAIFKREIESCFKNFGILDGQQIDVLKILFENPIDVTKQYLLKKEMSTIDDVAKCLKGVVNKDDFIADVRSLFEVSDDLELPDSLREQLARKQAIAIFIGAGVSKILNVPLWGDLASKAIDYLYEINRITFSEADKIKMESVSPKQKMSIFHDILPKAEAKEFYERHFIPDKKFLNRNPYDILVKLDVPKFTSNLDHEFWNALAREKSKDEKTRPVQVVSGFNDDISIVTNAIYQIHGSYQQLDSYSIVTMRDYLMHYFQDPCLRNFLKSIFNKYVVIFIGYGMEEFEILQDLVKSDKGHHVLVSTYLSDSNLLRVRKEYFRKTLGMNAHGYYLDFNGYDRLYEVIDSWIKKIAFEVKGDFYQKTGEYGDVEL